jgi:hypothetical protein
MEMPKPNTFTLFLRNAADVFISVLSCEPDNWRELEMGIVRETLAVNREITSEFIFSGTVATSLKAHYTTYGFSARATLNFAKRSNDWTYAAFNTFTADFKTYKYSNRKVTLTFMENSVRQALEDNMTTKYEFVMPDTYKLSYTGVSMNVTNVLRPDEGLMPYVSNSCWVMKGFRSARENSTYLGFSDTAGTAYGRMQAQVLVSTTVTIKITLGVVNLMKDGIVARFAKLRLLKGTIQGSNIVINKFQTPLYSWDATDYSDNYYWFEDQTERTITATCLAGEYLLLCFDETAAGATQVYLISADTLTMSLVSTEASRFQAYNVSVVPHEWLLAQLLARIAPTAVLDYNLPAFDSAVAQIPVLASSQSLLRTASPVITCSLEDVFKSLRCLYGADYDITGTSVRVDYPSTFFGASALEVVPVTEPTFEADTEHVYNRIKVGYETDDDAYNGQMEFNCINTFTIDKSGDKELDLVHPFKASMYTIEQFLRDKDESSSTSKESDNDVFLFSVHPFNQGTITDTTILYRGTIGGTQIASYGTLPDTAYNVPLSPMRLLLANAAYIGVSVHKKTKALVFASTDRNASVRTLCPWETTYTSGVSENNGLVGQPISTLMASPLFVPEIVRFDTAHKFWTLASINDNLYKFFSFTDKKTLEVHYFYIKDVTLQLAWINSQTWIGLTKL